MIIGVDVDDVLAEFGDKLRSFHNKNHGTSLEREDINNFALEKVWNCTREEAKQRVLDFYQSDDFDSIIPLQDAVESINFLVKKHRLVAITSRPEQIREKTREWINKHFSGKFEGIYFTTRNGMKKIDICIEKNVSVFIEDNLEYATEIANQGIRVLLMSAPWNKCLGEELHKNITRVKSWDEVMKEIDNIKILD